MNSSIVKRIPNKYARIAALGMAAILLLSVAGCTAQAPQGWSGCSSDGTNIYYGSSDGKIICINPEARSANLTFPHRESNEWYFSLRAPASSSMLGCGQPSSVGQTIYSTPAIGDELVYLATYYGINQGKLYAFTSGAGSERWINPREAQDSLGHIVGNILLADKNIYLTSENGKIYAFDQVYGDKLWDFDTQERIWTSPAYNNGTLFVANYKGTVYALSSQNLTEIWHVQLPAAVASSPVVYRDNIVVGAFDHSLYSISQTDGKIAWNFKGENWFWADPVVQDDYIFAACLDKKIYAISGDTGRSVWEYETSSAVSAKPYVAGNMLAAATEEGDIYILETSSGVLLQQYSLEAKVLAPLLIQDNILYVRSQDNYTHAIDLAGEKATWKFKAVIE